MVLRVPASLAGRLGTNPGRKATAALVSARHGVALRRGAVSAAGSWQSLANEFGQRLPVLCFHRVGPQVEGANPELTITPARFSAQLRLLRRLGYTPITSAAWVAWCRSAESMPRRPVLLTFDDAYPDLHEYAFPVLADGGYGATLFVPSARLGGENTWDEALRAGSHPVAHRLLDAADLVAWSRRGIEVGAHSRTHARLPELSPDEVIAETEGSKYELERLARCSRYGVRLSVRSGRRTRARSRRHRVRRRVYDRGGAEYTRDRSSPPVPERRPANGHRFRCFLPGLARLEPSAPAQVPAAAVVPPVKLALGTFLRRAVPSRLRILARRRGLASWPPRGAIRFGTLRRTHPISSDFGFDRGTPVDRHYIDVFLREHAGDVRGRVLEVGDDRYTCAFGGDAVENVSVLNLVPTGAANEIVDDLAHSTLLAAETFDCVICVQTLHLIYELEAAVKTLRRILRSNGVLLATIPGISQISSDEGRTWRDHWRLTCDSATRAFGDAFGNDNVSVRGYGNVLTSIAFLHGIAAEELDSEELDFRDTAYDLLVGVRAQRSARRRP